MIENKSRTFSVTGMFDEFEQKIHFKNLQNICKFMAQNIEKRKFLL